MTTTVETQDALAEVFQQMTDEFNELSYAGPLTAFQEILAEGERLAFASGRGPGGEEWPLLAPSTVKHKGHSQILVETGRLGLSLTSVGGPGNINTVAERGSIFGTDVEYSIFNMSRRPHVGTNEAAVDKLADMIAEHAIESLKE